MAETVEKTSKDKSIFKDQPTVGFGALYLTALRAPIDVRLVVNKESDLFIISGDDITEERSNVAYDGMFVWVRKERAFYVYDEAESNGLIYPQKDRLENPYENIPDSEHPDPNPNFDNDGNPIVPKRTKWKKYAIQAVQVESSVEADRLKETKLIQGHAFDGTQNVESGFFYPEELTLTAEENEQNSSVSDKKLALKNKMKALTQSGFYHGAYPDNSGAFGLEVVLMGNGNYRRTLTEYSDGKVNVYSITGQTDENTEWELQLHPCSVKRIMDFSRVEREAGNTVETGIKFNVAVGDDFAEKWLFMHRDLPRGTRFVRDSKGYEYDLLEATSNVVEQPYYLRLINNGHSRMVEIVSLAANAERYGFVRLSDSYADDNSDIDKRTAATPKAVAELNKALSGALADEAYARETADTTLQTNIDSEAEARETADTTLQTNIDSHAADEATGAVSAHVMLSDSDYQPELGADSHVAATPKAVSTKSNITTLAAEFDPTATYTIGDLVTRQGNLYRCIDDYADPDIFEANFEESGDSADIEKSYAVGECIVNDDNLYRCKLAVDLPALLQKVAPFEFGSHYNYAAGEIVEWLGNYYQITADVTVYDVLGKNLDPTNITSIETPIYDPHFEYSYYRRIKIYDELRSVWNFYYTESYYEGTIRKNLTPDRLTEWLTTNAVQLNVAENFGANSIFDALNVVKLNDFIYRIADNSTALDMVEYFEKINFIDVAKDEPIGRISQGSFIRRASVIYRSLYNYPASFAEMFEMITVAGRLMAEISARKAADEVEANKRSAADIALEEKITQAKGYCLKADGTHAAVRATDGTLGHVILTDQIRGNVNTEFGIAVTPKAVADFVQQYVSAAITNALANQEPVAEIPQGNTYRLNISGNVFAAEILIDNGIQVEDGDTLIITYHNIESREYWPDYIRLYTADTYTGNANSIINISSVGFEFSVHNAHYWSKVITYQVINGRGEVTDIIQ